VVKAEAAFMAARDIAAAAGLRLWQVRALQELGTIDLFGSLSPDRLLEARRMAVSLGALSTVAVVDLQLGALYDERGDLAESLAASTRCEEASRRWRLSTLAMSLGVQAAAHARLGDREAMERACDAALATDEDQDNVVQAVQGNTVPVLHILQGDLAAAAQAVGVAMEVLRRNPGIAQPFPGLWALLRTLVDDDGEAARREVAALAVDTPVSRELLVVAEAVARGRGGDTEGAAARFAEADAALGRRQGGFRQAWTRLLVAPAALADDWGEPLPWLRETLATFEAKGLDAFARRCRTVLREAGAPVPRRGRGDTALVPPELAALGITGREVDVLALVATGATNREVGDALFISVRTVDKHVERLLQKAGTTRAGLAEVAREVGLLPT
jgi:ATP/maltotriose-dependent transcriptional regulator MalT